MDEEQKKAVKFVDKINSVSKFISGGITNSPAWFFIYKKFGKTSQYGDPDRFVTTVGAPGSVTWEIREYPAPIPPGGTTDS